MLRSILRSATLRLGACIGLGAFLALGSGGSAMADGEEVFFEEIKKLPSGPWTNYSVEKTFCSRGKGGDSCVTRGKRDRFLGYDHHHKRGYGKHHGHHHGHHHGYAHHHHRGHLSQTWSRPSPAPRHVARIYRDGLLYSPYRTHHSSTTPQTGSHFGYRDVYQHTPAAVYTGVGASVDDAFPFDRRCQHWAYRCSEVSSFGGSEYLGCMRYHSCG
ncbi:MAG: hypothetical protein AAF909_14925 [Pseudomonadota bacterium]